MERDNDTNCNWCTQYSHQRIGTGTGRLGDEKTSGDPPNYSIAEISQSPGDLLSLNEKPLANAGMKNSQKSKIMIIGSNQKLKLIS